MKRKIAAIILLTAVLAASLAGCGGNKFELKEIKKYFFEAGTYTTLDYDFANNYFAETYDSWGGGCSAISTVIGGRRLVGRNMDLNISNKCAYVVRTDVPGKYETVGLAYTFRDISPDYELLKKEGLSPDFQKILPFMCDDVLNSKGLHIEINMRHGEQDADGNDLFSVEHTNAAAAQRIYVFELGQYVGLNCKDLDDVKKYLAEKIDVYTQPNYWSYCFVITDAKGNSALLEFGNGRYYWVEPDANGVVAQTNFFVNEECNKLEDIKTGLGRYDVMMAEIGGVQNKADLYKLMQKIQYSSYYLPYAECKSEHFDPRSEAIGEVEGFDYAFVMAPENEEFLEQLHTELYAPIRAMSREEKQNKNELWESTFTAVIDPKAGTIDVRIFENEDYMYQITLKGIKEISEIK